jgi:transposase
MNKSRKFSPEVRERTVRLVQAHRGEYPSLWAAVESIAPKIRCVPQTLLEWFKLARRPPGSEACWSKVPDAH